MTKANTPKTSPNSSVKPTPASKGCGGTLTAPTGGFQSPNFPSAYPANSYCKWTISVPQDYAAIDIKLDQMNLEYEESCQNDYIAIDDELGNQVGCRRCGAYTKPIEFQVRGRVAVIEFNSDSTVHKTGFKLTYKGYLRIIPRVVHEQIVTDEALDDLSAMLDEIE
ncbi:hypothetical protein QZH41_008391 [Actinostola sp. cb2023]|nr:hypothetical protein QZH41_008391 [Actinostola sp. cb2023]